MSLVEQSLPVVKVVVEGDHKKAVEYAKLLYNFAVAAAEYIDWYGAKERKGTIRTCLVVAVAFALINLLLIQLGYINGTLGWVETILPLFAISVVVWVVVFLWIVPESVRVMAQHQRLCDWASACNSLLKRHAAVLAAGGGLDHPEMAYLQLLSGLEPDGQVELVWNNWFHACMLGVVDEEFRSDFVRWIQASIIEELWPQWYEEHKNEIEAEPEPEEEDDENEDEEGDDEEDDEDAKEDEPVADAQET